MFCPIPTVAIFFAGAFFVGAFLGATVLAAATGSAKSLASVDLGISFAASGERDNFSRTLTASSTQVVNGVSNTFAAGLLGAGFGGAGLDAMNSAPKSSSKSESHYDR
jgi:hypothetical protein